MWKIFFTYSHKNPCSNYDIDEVLKAFEDKSSKRKKKKSKRKKYNAKLESEKAVDPITVAQNDPTDNEQPRGNKQVNDSETAKLDSKIFTKATEDMVISSTDRSNSECSICFCDRIRTFALVPCGHATFCEDCAKRILENVRKCPTCQSVIDTKLRVFI